MSFRAMAVWSFRPRSVQQARSLHFRGICASEKVRLYGRFMGRGANGATSQAVTTRTASGINRRRRGAGQTLTLELRSAREAYQVRQRLEEMQRRLQRKYFRDADYQQLAAAVREIEEDLAYRESRAGGRTYRLTSEGHAQLQRRLGRLNRRSERQGLPGTSVRQIAVETARHQVNGVTVAQPYEYVILHVPEAQFSDWSFAAVLDHHRDQDGSEHTVIRRLPGQPDVADLSPYYDAPASCDHCGANRRRRDTYVVITPDGQTMQVGSSCLREVTGQENPHQIAKLAEELLAIDEELKAQERETPGTRTGPRASAPALPQFSIDDFLAAVVAQQREDGRYISRSQDRDYNTASSAYDRLFGQFAGNRQAGLTDSDRAEAVAALDWVRNDLADRDDLDEFSQNLVSACSADAVSEKRAGLVAYAVAAHRRDQEKAARQQAAAQAAQAAQAVGHYGAVRERAVIRNLTVVNSGASETMYGISYRYNLRTPEGHELIWWASRDVLERGRTYDLKATIKAHDEYNGSPQTVITRCTVQ
jgi:hypothetical protein